MIDPKDWGGEYAELKTITNHKEEAKMYRGIVAIMGFVWILTAMLCGSSFKDNAKLKEIIKIRTIRSHHHSTQARAFRDSMHNARITNIILRGHLCFKDEQKLLNDSSYLKLITK